MAELSFTAIRRTEPLPYATCEGQPVWQRERSKQAKARALLLRVVRGANRCSGSEAGFQEPSTHDYKPPQIGSPTYTSWAALPAHRSTAFTAVPLMMWKTQKPSCAAAMRLAINLMAAMQLGFHVYHLISNTAVNVRGSSEEGFKPCMCSGAGSIWRRRR